MRENAERGSTAPHGFESRSNLIFFSRLSFHNFRAQLWCYSDIFRGKDSGKKTHQPFSYETCFNGDHYFVIVACEQSGCSIRLPM